MYGGGWGGKDLSFVVIGTDTKGNVVSGAQGRFECGGLCCYFDYPDGIRSLNEAIF